MSPDIIGNGQKAVREGISPYFNAEVIPIHTAEDFDNVVYVVRVPQSRHVPHVIGIKTPKKEIDLIRDRLNWAKELAQEQNENEQRTN